MQLYNFRDCKLIMYCLPVIVKITVSFSGKKYNVLKKLPLIALSIIVACCIMPETAFAASYVFTNTVNLSNVSSPTDAVNPRILVNGSHVYVTWENNTSGKGYLNFEKSSDNGTTFNGGTPGAPVSMNIANELSRLQQMTVSGPNLYLVWDDNETGSGDIYFEKSPDSGITFNGGTPGAPVNLSNTVQQSTTPQISTSGSNVYVVWRDSTTGSGDIYFEKSPDSGITFNGGTPGSPGAPVNLSNDTALSSTPEIATSHSNVYVIWSDSTTGSGDIYFEKSSDSGITFNGGTPGAPVNLSNNFGISQVPQIVTSGSNVYVVWFDKTTGPGDIYFEKSSDNGTTFNGGTLGSPGAPVNLSLSNTGASTVPQLSVSGSNVYVVWQDATTGFNDIYFEKSSDNGTTFNGGTLGSPGAPVNLSLSNTGASTVPQLFVSGSNVYVIWRDATPGNNEIFFSASSDNGTTFNGGTSGSPGNPTNISNTTDFSDTPQVGAFGTTPFVVWSESNSTLANILFVHASPSLVQVSFDKTQYKLQDTVTLDMTSPSSNTNSLTVQTIHATVKSTSDSNGITVPLVETGTNTGIFRGQFTFTSATSSGTSLKANAGNTITASFNGQSDTATIFSRTISFDFSTNTLSHVSVITVDDKNSITNSSAVQIIPITVKSTTMPSGISLKLTETGNGTGIFQNTGLIFTTGTALFHTTDTVKITQDENNTGQAINGVIDTLSVNVGSTTDSAGLDIVLTETGPNTGSFAGKLNFTTTGPSVANTLKVSNGDIIGVTYLGETARGLIIPNPNSGIGALSSAINDTVTATYLGSTGTTFIQPGSGGGGGGGGLIRPGLVLDIIAASVHGGSSVSPSLDLTRLASMQGLLPDYILDLVLHHDPFKPIPPIRDKSFDFPLSIDGNGYALGGTTNTIVTEKKNIHIPVDMLLNFMSSNEIIHAAFYMNLPHDSDDLYKSDTYVIYEKGEPLQIVDPHRFFDNVKFNITKSNLKNLIDYKITFAKPMNKSDIDFLIWDKNHSSANTRILDALQVVTLPNVTNMSGQTLNQSSGITNIPQKDNTVAHANLEDMMPAIKDWGGYSSTPISDSEFLDKIGLHGNHIPSWFMKTARLVVDEKTSVKEFLAALRYMHDKNMTK